MYPFTFGAIPTKLARTVASSVSGRFSHCQIPTTIATAAAIRIRAPTRRPTARRDLSRGSSGSTIASATEHSQPEDQGDEEHQARVHDGGSRPEIRIDSRARAELPEEDGAENAEHQG